MLPAIFLLSIIAIILSQLNNCLPKRFYVWPIAIDNFRVSPDPSICIFGIFSKSIFP